MRRLQSFRARLLLGALLAAVGMLPFVHLASMMLLRHRLVVTFSHAAALVLLVALALILLGVAHVRSGLSPFDVLRARLAAVREGRARLIEGLYPTEVQPLVSDLNAFLEHREAIVRRALATAGDLAHGLKTPLAVLAQEASLLRAAGEEERAGILDEQVERMRRQVDYHLAQARAAASGAIPGARCSVRESVDALVRTLSRLHADRGLTVDVQVAPAHAVGGQREDLDEMLGNLLDNACKWARSRVVVATAAEPGAVVITIDDDGPGLDPSMRDRVLQRGVRADEAAPGSGLGLAIVRDLAALYGGSVELAASPAGGLRARLRLPA